jgi:hypothetical protein
VRAKDEVDRVFLRRVLAQRDGADLLTERCGLAPLWSTPSHRLGSVLAALAIVALLLAIVLGWW